MLKQRNVLATLTLVSSMLLGATSNAESYDDYSNSAYIGINLAALEYAEDGFEEATVSAIYTRLGKQYTENFSAEFRLGFGLGSDTIVDPDLSLDIDFEVQEFYGVFLKSGIPVGERAYPYILLGYTQISAESSALGFTYEDTVDDFSYGIGVDVELYQDVEGSIELVNYGDKQGAKFTSFSLGISKAF